MCEGTRKGTQRMRVKARDLGAVGAMLAVAVLTVSGCHMESSKKEDSEQFRLATPMGALQVKTDAAAAQSGVGLPVYAGATLLPVDSEHNAIFQSLDRVPRREGPG